MIIKYKHRVEIRYPELYAYNRVEEVKK